MLAILTADKARAQESLERAMQKGIPAAQLLDIFLQNIKTDIQSGENRFSFAVHEFAFIEPSQSSYLQSRFESAVIMLSALLCYGQQTGEYKRFDASHRRGAHHVLPGQPCYPPPPPCRYPKS